MQTFLGDQTPRAFLEDRGDLCARSAPLRPARRPRSAVRATFPAAAAGLGGAAGGAGPAAGKAGARAHRRAAAPNGSAGSIAAALDPEPRSLHRCCCGLGPRPIPAAIAPGQLTLHAGQGGATRRPGSPTPAPGPRAQPGPPSLPGRWRRPARALRAPRSPPAPRRAPARPGATFLKGQVAGIRSTCAPRLGLLACPRLFRGERGLQSLHPPTALPAGQRRIASFNAPGILLPFNAFGLNRSSRQARRHVVAATVGKVGRGVSLPWRPTPPGAPRRARLAAAGKRRLPSP